jgi:hypothetical protein
MSSVLSAYAQIPAREKFFLCIGGGVANNALNLADDTVMAVRFPQGAFGPSDQIANNTVASYSGTSLVVTPQLYMRDLGRALYVYDQVGVGANLMCIFRQVAHVAGLYTEGVVDLADPTFPPPYLKIWSSSGGGIAGTRTG